MTGHECSASCPSVRLALRWRCEYPTLHASGSQFRYLDGVPIGGSARFSSDEPLVMPTVPSVDCVSVDSTVCRRYVFKEPVVMAETVDKMYVCDRPDVATSQFPPRPISLSTKMEIVRRWVEACSSYALAEGAVCCPASSSAGSVNLCSTNNARICIFSLHNGRSFADTVYGQFAPHLEPALCVCPRTTQARALDAGELAWRAKPTKSSGCWCS